MSEFFTGQGRSKIFTSIFETIHFRKKIIKFFNREALLVPSNGVSLHLFDAHDLISNRLWRKGIFNDLSY